MDLPRATFIFSLIFHYPWDIISFNIDIQHPTVIRGRANSYFGYTVALHNNSAGNWLLVGAPKANSTYLKQKYGIKEPGVLFKCRLDYDTSNCTEITVDKTGNTAFDIHNKEIAYKDMKDEGWLGASLDVKPKNESEIVVCAHMWKNQRYVLHRLPNGVCYTIPSSLNTSAVRKLTPLVAHKRQIIEPGIYYYALGQAGFASHYTENGNIVLGAPGILDWTGSIVYYSQLKNKGLYSKPAIPIPILEEPEVIYFGYSVSSGKFFADESSEYLVVGAPRDLNTGRVYVISQPQGGARLEELLIKIRKEGSQMGEYFGACVSAIDFNSDGLADLIVGAPQHALRVNEGRVYVYINQGSGLLKPVKDSIMGDAMANSHFGSAVGAIGDINQDGYRDVAVGAPYEDGRGAVYVYHGTSAGFNTKYVQKIQPEKINPLIKGFGISFSRGKDMDENQYPDFAVGAFDSNHAIFFKTRPVIQLSATVNFEPNQIAANVTKCHSSNGTLWTCFSIETCLHFSANWIPFKLDIDLSIELDTFKINDSRTFFEVGTKKVTKLNSVESLNKSEDTCDFHKVFVKDDVNDFLTPINILLTYTIHESESQSDKFCKSCPIADPALPTTHSKQIMFTKNCGDDDRCHSDLRLSAQIRNLELGQPFIIGSSNYLLLDLIIWNEGEPAYQTTLDIIAPHWIHFQRLPHTCALQDDDFVATCFLGNPIKSKEKTQLSVNINVENMPSKARELLFNITVQTASIELEENLMDNSIQIVVPLKKIADIAIFGISSQEQISGTTETKLSFSHKYEVSKFEPSPIDSVTMEISVPITTIQHKDSQLTLFNIRSVKFHETISTNAIFGSCQGIDQQLLTADFYKHQRKIRSVNQAYNNLRVFNCSDMNCVVIRCLLGNFVRNETLALELEIEANVADLHIYMSQFDSVDALEFVTSGQVIINDEDSNIQPNSHKADSAWVSTFFISATLKPEPPSLWIIILSSLAGCLLLFALTMALVKVGFFRRERREEMRNLIHSSQIVKEKYNLSDIHNVTFTNDRAFGITYDY